MQNHQAQCVPCPPCPQGRGSRLVLVLCCASAAAGGLGVWWYEVVMVQGAGGKNWWWDQGLEGPGAKVTLWPRTSQVHGG